jgi:copper(I)-binding protein
VKAARVRGRAVPWLLPGALIVIGVIATGALAIAVGSSRHSPAARPSQAPPTPATGPTALLGTTVEIGGTMDVVTARIPAPPAGSATAQVEMTLASTSLAGQDALRAASSPAARTIVFTSHSRVIPAITIPVTGGAGVTMGPPYPDRILLTGLRHRLRAGQTVTISLTFARAGQATLRVPVIPPVP